MGEVKVWAPKAGRVELHLGGSPPARQPMEPEESGWWSVKSTALGPGVNYGFLVDGEGPFPDPCSPWQPDGVHGLSRMVDHAAFDWQGDLYRAAPLASAVIYELHVGTFSPEGTFDGAIARLDHLKSLGVSHVELLPVNQFSGPRGWGYDGVGLYAPHHAYGGPDGLKRLVRACHQHGLAVIQDVVYNHLGPEGNYLEKFGPYQSQQHFTGWGRSMNFDEAFADEVRKFFIDNALMWLRDYHVDALRLDAIHAMLDTSAYPFLEELADRVRGLAASIGRPLALIAESDLNDPRLVRPPEAGGFGLDAVWSDDFHHALHVTLTGEQNGYYAGFAPYVSLAKAYERVFVYDGCYAPYRGRQHGRPADGTPTDRFLGYLQNHDQVGNRARGERIVHLVGPELAKAGAALVLAAPFVPMLFQGEEWGASSPFQYFTSHEDEVLGRAVSEGRRGEFSEFGWEPEDVPDPQSIETFRRSKLNWDEIEQEPHAGLLDWHRRLIALRRAVPELTDPRPGQTAARFDREAGWFAFLRGPVVVACSLAGQGARIPFARVQPGSQVLLASDPACRLEDDAAVLPPYGVIVYR